MNKLAYFCHLENWVEMVGGVAISDDKLCLEFSFCHSTNRLSVPLLSLCFRHSEPLPLLFPTNNYKEVV